MKISTTAIDGVLVIEPKVFGDSRGFFLESFNARDFADGTARHVEFVQDNQSRSVRGVLRGLHWQEAPHSQGKLVRVVSGSVFDVAVDIRRASSTFGRWVGIELSGDNHRQIWIEPGLAHGFVVLSETADVLYKATSYYTPAAERSIRFDDPDLAIDWPDVGTAPKVSAKDAGGMSFAAWRDESGAATR